MAVGNLQVSQGQCAACGAGKVQRNAMVWGGGDLLLVVLTFLLWLPLKFAFNALANPWRCAKCGGAARVLFVLAVLLLGACDDSPNRQEFVNLSIQTLQDHDRITALATAKPGASPLTDDVAMLKAQVAALMEANAALQGQMAALTAARKVPHLVSRDTGVDYGVSIDGALAAWDERFGAVIDYAASRTVSFTGPKCSGDPLFDSNLDIASKFNRYLFMPDGRLARLASGTRVNAPNGSTMEPDGTCTDYPSVNGYPAVVSRFDTPRAFPESLDIQLR